MISDLWVAFLYLFVPTMLASVVVATPALLFLRHRVSKASQTTYSFVVAFGLVGTVLGVIAGASTKSITEPLVAGLLGIVSSGVTYLLSKESLRDWDLRPALPVALIVLLLGSLSGLAVGASYKKAHANYERTYARRMLLYEKVDLPVCKEERLMRLQGKAIPADYKSESCPPNK